MEEGVGLERTSALMHMTSYFACQKMFRQRHVLYTLRLVPRWAGMRGVLEYAYVHNSEYIGGRCVLVCSHGLCVLGSYAAKTG